MTLVVRLFKRETIIEIAYCKAFLKMLGVLEDAKLLIYDSYPNISQGEILATLNATQIDPIEETIKKYNLYNRPYSGLIYQFEFKIKLDRVLFDSYLRINNDFFSTFMGTIEFDIFPKGDIINLGDYFTLKSSKPMKDLIQRWIKESSKLYNIAIKEAYVGVSYGDFRVDYSKRIWAYHRYPKDFLIDVIKFIKNIQSLTVPEYLKKEYIPLLDNLAPYSEAFVAKEFTDSEKFNQLFSAFTNANKIKVGHGSLLLDTETTENTLLLLRYLSESIIEPVMKQVIGKKAFESLINNSLKETKK